MGPPKISPTHFCQPTHNRLQAIATKCHYEIQTNEIQRSIPADLNDEAINRRSRPSESDKMSHPSGIQSDMYSQGDCEGPNQNTRSSRHQKSSRPQTTECRSNDSRSEKSHESRELIPGTSNWDHKSSDRKPFYSQPGTLGKSDDDVIRNT